MAKTSIHSFQVEFGDCDPAQIAYYPNFFRWFDNSTFQFFRSCGIPPLREWEKLYGLIGFPVVNSSCQYLSPTTAGDRLEVHTSIVEWRRTSFVLKHELRRGEELLAEGTEVRVFAARQSDDPTRIKAVPPPDELRRLAS